MMIEELKKVIVQSHYPVVLCGNDMLKECGILPLRSQERAYEIERIYRHSPEEFLSQAFYSTRPEPFYHFYRNEILKYFDAPVKVFCLLRDFQKLASVRCIITNSFFGFPSRAGCKHVIELHGNINHNTCDQCGAVFSADYVLHSKRCPVCDQYGGPIRPGIIFYGDMVNNRLMTMAATEISHADTLLMLGCSLDTELARRYIKYFEGNKLILVHSEHHYLDGEADLSVYGSITDTLHMLNHYLGLGKVGKYGQ